MCPRVLAAVCALGIAFPAPAAAPDPLRLVPKQADLFVRVESPRKLVEAFAEFFLFEQA